MVGHRANASELHIMGGSNASPHFYILAINPCQVH
jgi:hypothetical protein